MTVEEMIEKLMDLPLKEEVWVMDEEDNGRKVEDIGSLGTCGGVGVFVSGKI